MASSSSLQHRKQTRISQGQDALRSTGWLSRMPPEFQEALLRIGIWRIATPGETFVRAGDANGGLVAIGEGVVEIAMAGGHPDTRFIHIARAGHWAGFRPILGKSRNVNLLAQTEVLWFLVPQSALSRLLTERPHYWMHIAQLVNEAYEITTSIMVDLTRRNGRSRLAGAVLRLAGCRFQDPVQARDVEVNVPQGELAALAVMSRNTVSSYLAELADLGLIDIRYRGIRIVDVAGLRALLDAED